MKQLIINTEYFLQCYGQCSGCFLSTEERNSNNTYHNNVLESLKELAKKYENTRIEKLVIGFGRGNLLNLSENDLTKLSEIITWCETNFLYDEITFEISTSLIGKIDQQIEKALGLLRFSKRIYFNMVMNSEITSQQFWKNLKEFYFATSEFRKTFFNMNDNWGDILVLNINPSKLPNIDFLTNFIYEYNSPINISFFPFEKGELTVEYLKNLEVWSSILYEKFSDKDLNIKNYLEGLQKNDVSNNIHEILEFQNYTEKCYYFIDKLGKISNGSLSIMGEVDKIRLLDKYDIELNILDGYRTMQKRKACSMCEYQKECLLSGAYLNLLANVKANIKSTHEKDFCLSGYQKIFELHTKR